MREVGGRGELASLVVAGVYVETHQAPLSSPVSLRVETSIAVRPFAFCRCRSLRALKPTQETGHGSARKFFTTGDCGNSSTPAHPHFPFELGNVLTLMLLAVWFAVREGTLPSLALCLQSFHRELV